MKGEELLGNKQPNKVNIFLSFENSKQKGIKGKG